MMGSALARGPQSTFSKATHMRSDCLSLAQVKICRGIIIRSIRKSVMLRMNSMALLLEDLFTVCDRNY